MAPKVVSLTAGLLCGTAGGGFPQSTREDDQEKRGRGRERESEKERGGKITK